jgi:hypothetical protein
MWFKRMARTFIPHFSGFRAAHVRATSALSLLYSPQRSTLVVDIPWGRCASFANSMIYYAFDEYVRFSFIFGMMPYGRLLVGRSPFKDAFIGET